MPKSNYGCKRWSKAMLTALNNIAPLKRIIDVGPGIGTYTSFRQPGQQWVGVEVWAPYVRTYELEKKYDQVVVADIRYLDWSQFTPVDVVIFGDILEHMAKEEAVKVVDRALRVARVALISVPVVESIQDELEGNPFERHVKTDWTNEEVWNTFPDICTNMLESYIGAYLLSRSPGDRYLIGQIAAKYVPSGATVVQTAAIQPG